MLGELTNRLVLSLLAIVAALALFASGCTRQPPRFDYSNGGGRQGTEADRGAPGVSGPEKRLRIAIVLPGSAADRGFNESAAEAAPVLEERLGAQVNVAEMTAPSDFEKAFRDFASAGYDVVIGHGFEFGDVAEAVAPSYPNTYFFVTNNPRLAGPNSKGLQPRSHESAYLAGVAAGSLTVSKKIAAVGGFSFPVIVAQIKAFELGVRSVRPDAEVRNVYLNTFDDIDKGKEAALALASEGIDIIYHIADSAGVGVISGARQAGIYAIGWGKDQHDLAPGTVVTSQIVDQKAMIVQAVEEYKHGNMPDGVWRFGLDSGVTGLAPVRARDATASANAQSKVDEARASILAGRIQVPFITEPS